MPLLLALAGFGTVAASITGLLGFSIGRGSVSGSTVPSVPVAPEATISNYQWVKVGMMGIGLALGYKVLKDVFN